VLPQLHKNFPIGLHVKPSCLRLSQFGNDVAVEEKERTGSTSFLPVLSRLSFVDWVTGGERQSGGKLTEFSWWLLKSQAVTLPLVYVEFGTIEILGVVCPTGVTESSLEAPSSSADVRVCKQNWVWFLGSRILFGIWLGYPASG
jgi:hypothetical protein